MKIVVYDLEIATPIGEEYEEGKEYSFDSPELLIPSITCTFSTEKGYQDWALPTLPTLAKFISWHDIAIGFNNIGFDNAVIRGNLPPGDVEGFDTKFVDLLLDVKERLGFRVGLDDIIRATLHNHQKPEGMKGADAPCAWREGMLLEVISYCRNDVMMTGELFTYGVEHGVFKYPNKKLGGRSVKVDVEWKTRDKDGKVLEKYIDLHMEEKDANKDIQP